MTTPDHLVHVVFGATGAIGTAMVAELMRRGERVRAVSRRGQAPHGAEGVTADAADPAQAAAAAAGAAVVYHCASPPYTRWPELFPPLTRSILDAAESSGAKLVYADNLYAYGPVDGPLREDLPAAAPGRKGQVRVEMAAQLLAAHRDGLARVVIGRASDYYGPHGTGSTAGETVFGRILTGKKPQWTGRLDQPHTFHYLPDIARGLLVLAGRPEADGQVWHLPAAEPLTAHQFFDMIAEAAGQPVPVHASVAPRRCSRSRASSRHCCARCARPPTSSARPSSSTPASSKPPSAPWSPPRTATRCSGPSPGTAPANLRPSRILGPRSRAAAALNMSRREMLGKRQIAE